MIKIKVKTHKETDDELFDPIEMFGAKHGDVYQLYPGGKPYNTYFISTGPHDRPICIWYDIENEEWALSSDDRKDLQEFNSDVKVKKLHNSFVKLKLTVSE